MNKKITYIFRKRLPQYNSIEELFGSVEQEISKSNQVATIELKNSGASPWVLIKNIFSFDKKKNELYHITGDVHYMALATGKNTILTIHDIKSATKGNFLKQFYIRLFWFWLPSLIVKRITVISEFTKTELNRIIPFAKHKICVVHNPVNSRLKPHSYVFNTEKPTVLFIGTKSNKNLERSLRAIHQLTCKVLIVGKLSSSQMQILKQLNIAFENKTDLNYDEIIECYKDADLLCFASTYEGFGMPIIEAQAIGRPVVTSNFGAMMEVADDSACFVNPYDVDSIREGILKICADVTYRQHLMDKGFENVKRFQLETISKEYLAIYEEVLK